MENTTWKFLAYGIYARVVDVSDILSAFYFKDFQSAKMINLLLHIVK